MLKLLIIVSIIYKDQKIIKKYPPVKSTAFLSNHVIIGNNVSAQLVNLLPEVGKSPPTFDYGKAGISSSFSAKASSNSPVPLPLIEEIVK